MPELKKKIAKFRIISANIDQFATFEENYNSKDGVINIKSSIGYTFNAESRVIECKCEVRCFMEEKIVVKASITMAYELDPTTIQDLTSKSRIIIPKDLLAYFGSNAYGSLRGVLIAKLEGSAIRIILPLDSIADHVEKPLVVEL